MLTAILIIVFINAVLIVLGAYLDWIIIREGRAVATSLEGYGSEAEVQARAARHGIKELVGALNLRERESVILAASRLDESDLKKIGTPVPGRVGIREIHGIEFYSAAWLDDKT
jgi:hypothetical protein